MSVLKSLPIGRPARATEQAVYLAKNSVLLCDPPPLFDDLMALSELLPGAAGWCPEVHNTLDCADLQLELTVTC